MNRAIVPVILMLIFCTLYSGCSTHPNTGKIPLKVVAAGSLLVPFSELESQYEALNPDIDVQVEGHGSIQAIRQVTDLYRKFDVVAVADESLIPDLMYRPSRETGKNFTDWYVPFARNEMVIAYTEKSLYHTEINETNWPEILAKPDVRVGFSNPMLDAAGYRALMVTMLAGDYYGDQTIFPRVIGNHFDPPLVMENSAQGYTVRLPEVPHPSDQHIVIRDGSIFLLSLLAAGGIDYAFEYRSVAEAQNLSYVNLPPEINLASTDYEDWYAKSHVILGFPRFSSIGQERGGRPIVYAMTVPSDATHPDEGQKFLQFVLGHEKIGERGWPASL
ncbi:MAG TPA: tungstate ABC transporter substrate-binding protein WtpA [Methanolinea sp.]|jgi:molybdate/tungstate transport system substrate-binding protein|nr:MAG: Molybdate/tungstate-binding protein WtpA precursor [Methanoregulaceae archaeon PtaB.Bin009]OPY42504.1 MAG: Molybdate/tungstate-binding protein WtpA precursor [Methanoregulaceae archaeon PtaU1.Bin066]HII75947.1 tungstate ABC transporter substrate-binding protein WtpA [Methanolinea sp.]HNQ28932.1 tungstate ABC transporter substrate-binding protein WtpA [Methanolinea sp.]